MKITRFLAAGLCLLAPFSTSAEIWDELTGGPHSWIDPTHWVGDATYPDAADAVADFQVNFGAAMSVELNDAITVGSLLINDTGGTGDVALTIAGGTGGSLIFEGAAASATVSSSGHIISAATTITSNTDFNIAAGSSLNISGDLGGAGIITKSGTGTLTLSGAASTYGGSYVLSGNSSSSVLSVGSDAHFGAVPGAVDADYLNVTNNNTLRFTAATTMNANRGITIADGATLTVDNATASSTIAGIITGSGGLTRSGSQNLTLSGLNTYTGVTTIGPGNFTGIRVSKIGNGGEAGGIGMASSDASNIILNGTAGNSAGILAYTGTGESTDRLFTINQSHGGLEAAGASGTITFSNAGAIAFGSTGNHTLLLQGNGLGSLNNLIQDQAVSNKTSVTKNSNGTWTLTGLNTYTGTTSIQGGVLSFSVLKDIGVASGLGSDGNIAFGNGGAAGGGSVTYTGGATSSNRNFVMTGTASNSNGGFTHNGTGLVELTYSGNLVTSAGTGNRNWTLGGNNTELNTYATKINAVSGVTVNFTKSGSGTWKLLNNTNDYTGVTTLNGGVLVVEVLANGGTASSIGASSNADSNLILHGGTLRYIGAATSTDRLFKIGTSQGTIDASGTGALKFTNSGDISQFGGNNGRSLTLTGTNQNDNTMGVRLVNIGSPTPSSSPLSLIKNGTGTWYLSNLDNTYTGTTTVNGGKLLLTGEAKLGNTNTTVNNTGSTFGGQGTTGGTVTVNAGAVIVAGDGLGTLSTGTLTMNGNSVFALELNTSTGASDLLNITGNFTLAAGNTAVLTLTDLGANVGLDNIYTIVNYSGTWTSNRLFNYDGSALADGGSFIFGNNEYTIDYNYDYGDADATTNAVTLTAVAVPEPGSPALALGAIGIVLLVRRRKPRANTRG